MNRTVITPPAPLFKINQTVYCRASIIRGYLEPLQIVGVEYVPAMREYVYSWQYGVGFNQFVPLDARITDIYGSRLDPPQRAQKTSPIRLPEGDLFCFLDALPIQIRALERQLAELQEKQRATCPFPLPPAKPIEYPEEVQGMINVPRPRFGYNQVAYLIESASIIGRLEAYRITSFAWDNKLRVWTYEMYIDRRPERAKTVGDDAQLTHDKRLAFYETELCSVCEALALSINIYH